MGRPSISSAHALHGPWGRPLDRFVYLAALQEETPFWRDLFASWQSDELELWAHRYAVRDAWLIDTCKSTLRSWADGSVCLDAVPCFVFPLEGIGATPALVSELQNVASSGGLLTSASAIYARTLLRDQLAILQGWRLRVHCGWCAQYQTGSTYAEIANAPDLDNYVDAATCVRAAIKRFARRIDLTLRRPASGCSCSLLP